jgi:regulator of cell morphogenesis and NO signaling
MNITTETNVGEIVRHNFSTARIFESYQIDFCCGGNISVSEAAKARGIDADQLLREVSSQLVEKDEDSIMIESLTLTGLSEYIVRKHHSYVNETVPFLQQKLQKLCDVHGENHPELFGVNESFNEAAGNLAAHMKKEELILFPYIRNTEQSLFEGKTTPAVPGKAAEIIAGMEQEHQAEGDRFMRIADITANYTVPADGCSTYEVTFKTLREFENDLHRHIHLENNILFPKALELEKKLT